MMEHLCDPEACEYPLTVTYDEMVIIKHALRMQFADVCNKDAKNIIDKLNEMLYSEHR